MIEIEVIDAPRAEQKFIKEAAWFYVTWLMPKAKTLRIAVEFERGLVKRTQNQAAIDVEDAKKHGAYRDFTITIDSGISLQKKFLALAHEMTHVKQYHTGEMDTSPLGFGYTVWMSKTYHEIDIDYFNTPWEIEAYGRERGMFARWIERAKYEKKYKWAKIDL